jgi:hypothetical protein
VASNRADRLANQIGIERAEAIPDFVTRFDVPDLLTSSRRAGF